MSSAASSSPAKAAARQRRPSTSCASTPSCPPSASASQADLEREPDKTLAFVSQMPILYGSDAEQASRYVCPMHPEVTATEASSCPKCGMKLVPDESAPTSYVCPMHPEVTASEPGDLPEMRDEARCLADCGSGRAPATERGHERPRTHGARPRHADGLEWEDLMPEINRQTNTDNMIWQLVDRETGAENHEITWAFTVGDRVKIRLANEMDQDHPMHHPFHIHGAGRFLVLSRDGEPEPNLVWKDTVLLRADQTIDILLDVTNPGLWMAHCHIAEHTESGMMFSFDVARRRSGHSSRGQHHDREAQGAVGLSKLPRPSQSRRRGLLHWPASMASNRASTGPPSEITSSHQASADS